jgi:hypothetical protein
MHSLSADQSNLVPRWEWCGRQKGRNFAAWHNRVRRAGRETTRLILDMIARELARPSHKQLPGMIATQSSTRVSSSSLLTPTSFHRSSGVRPARSATTRR